MTVAQIGSMIHHDGRNYDDAVAHALPIARQKLEALIEDGRAKQARVVAQLMDEAERRKDYLVPPSKLSFAGREEPTDTPLANAFSLWLSGDGAAQGFRFNEFSLGQMAGQLGVPQPFIKGVIDENPYIAAHILNDLRYRLGDSRRLIREVDGTVRAVLSDRFKPMDQGRVIEMFLKAVQETGALPLDGFCTDRRYVLRAVIPQVMQPLPNEVVALGVHISSSDYGAGALNLSVFQIRMWCTNLAVGESVFREVHLGGRMNGDDGLVQWSGRTISLQSMAALSEMKDAMRAILAPENRERIEASWRAAALERINPQGEADKLRKQSILSKESADSLVKLVQNEQRIEVLPVTPDPNSRLRFAQALSWLAQQVGGEKRLDLEAAAGRYLNN